MKICKLGDFLGCHFSLKSLTIGSSISEIFSFRQKPYYFIMGVSNYSLKPDGQTDRRTDTRKTHRQTHVQTDEQAELKTDRHRFTLNNCYTWNPSNVQLQTDRQTDRWKDRQKDRPTDRHTDRHADGQTNRHTDRHTDGQTNRQTDRHRFTLNNCYTWNQSNVQLQTDRRTYRRTDTQSDIVLLCIIVCLESIKCPGSEGQTDRETDRWTDRRTGRKKDRHRSTLYHSYTWNPSNVQLQTDRETDRWTDRRTDMRTAR